MTTATVSLSAVMTSAWTSARAAAIRFGGKARHFFRAALAASWAAARAPAERRFPIVSIRDVNDRKSGTVAYITCEIQTDVGRVHVSARTQMPTAHELRRDAKHLIVSGAVLASVEVAIEKARAENAVTTASMTDLERGLLRFGKLWEKNGHRRIYFEDETIFDAAGFACTFYGTGNMSWASQDGIEISNNSGKAVYARLRSAKIHYDLVAAEWSCMDTITDATWDRIRETPRRPRPGLTSMTSSIIPDWKESASALFGADWIAPLAVVLGCSRRTIERWRDGTSPVPAHVPPMLAAGVPTTGGFSSDLYGQKVLRQVAEGLDVALLRDSLRAELAAIDEYERRLAAGDALARIAAD